MSGDVGNDPDYVRLLDKLSDIVAPLEQLHRDAVRAYTPVVEDILRVGSRDVREIERTLDGLLDFCGYDSALMLYRRLCRHYWEIDAAAAVAYVNAYREYYDEGATRFRLPGAGRLAEGSWGQI
jgi:hypothetical protein